MAKLGHSLKAFIIIVKTSYTKNEFYNNFLK